MPLFFFEVRKYVEREGIFFYKKLVTTYQPTRIHTANATNMNCHGVREIGVFTAVFINIQFLSDDTV
jgi:hypothetical protein